MKKISILGGCASQLIAEKIPHVKAAGLTNWLSIASPEIQGCENVSDEFIEGLDMPNYDKRIMRLDLRKKLLDFLTEEKADFLLINCNDCRLNVILDDSAIKMDEKLRCLTYRGDGLEVQYDGMLRLIDPFHKYKIKSCYEIDMHYYQMAVDYICNIIKGVYDDDEIILHKPDYAEGYVDDNGYHRIYREKDTENPHTKEVVSFVQNAIQKNFPKCHIINFPDNVLADPNHFLGLHPLHYHPLYYEYGSKALNLIFENNPDEICLLEKLRKRYSEKFKEERGRLCLNSKIRCLEKRQNILMEIVTNIDKEASVSYLKKIDDFYFYLDLLSKIYRNYMICLSVRDTPGFYEDKNALDKLCKLGFKRYPNQLWKMYVGIVLNGVTIYDCPADEVDVPVVVDMKLNEIPIHIESRSFHMGNRSNIKINGLEYSLNSRGINLVVYDISKNKLVDSISFDSHIMNLFCRGQFNEK